LGFFTGRVGSGAAPGGSGVLGGTVGTTKGVAASAGAGVAGGDVDGGADRAVLHPAAAHRSANAAAVTLRITTSAI
jgi:hypothetical protein